MNELDVDAILKQLRDHADSICLIKPDGTEALEWAIDLIEASRRERIGSYEVGRKTITVGDKVFIQTAPRKHRFKARVREIVAVGGTPIEVEVVDLRKNAIRIFTPEQVQPQ